MAGLRYQALQSAYAYLAAVALAGALAGCQTARLEDTLERLDESSGVTLLRAAEPLVFARTEARYSRSARDYVYLGPIETNRQGQRDYYLWVGVGTTLDRGFLAPEATEPELLLTEVGGEPMIFELAPWLEREPSLTVGDVYEPAVKVGVALAARVSKQQIELLAQARLGSVQLVDGDGRMRSYVRWTTEPAWSGFLARTAALEQQ